MDARLQLELDEALALLRGRMERDTLHFLEQGDFATNLLHYLQRRQRPHLLFDFARLATIADLVTSLDPAEAAWEQEIADEAVAGRVLAATNPYCRRFVTLPPDFKYDVFVHQDKEALHGLCRHRWYACLARCYWRAQQPAYFEALLREWDSFSANVPFPDESFLANVHAMGETGLRPPFGELDIFIRLTNWYWAYWLALPSHLMTPARNAILLARCLRQFDLVAARGVKRHEHNFTSMQMEALYLWASALPEVIGMTVWKHAARNIMESSLERATWADGVQWEKSVSYHSGCICWYGVSYLLGQRNGEPWSPAYGERLRLMGRYTDAMVTPDGKTALQSDSDRVRGWERALAVLRVTFPDSAFQHPVAPSYYSLWVSNGQTWTATPGPMRRVACFPQAGTSVVRSGVGGGHHFLLLDNGPTLAGHSHKDNLTLHWDALGQPAIVDPGRWLYIQDHDRKWVLSPVAHNTLVPEDTPVHADQPETFAALQVIPAPGDPRIVPTTSEEHPEFVVLRTGLQAFTADATARVLRTVAVSTNPASAWLVVIDRVVAGQPHRWTNSWLLPTAEPVTPTADGFAARLDDGLALRCVHHAATPLEQRDEARFWCPNYAEKSPARWVRLSARERRPHRVFVFTAARGEEAPIPEVKVTRTTVTLRLHGVSHRLRA